MKLPVNEIFETIQGEASFTGTPSIFLRLQGCDVGCPWCDTKHTWETRAENEIDIGAMLAKSDSSATFALMSENDIIDALLKFSSRHVVITGGEPAQYDLRSLTGMAERIAPAKTVQIETSGTEQLRISNSTWVTLSPKINMPGGKKVLDENYRFADEIKWPVGKQADVNMLMAIKYALMPDRPGNSIWLQPLSTSEKATKLCIETATKQGFRLSIQTHKFIGVR